MRSVVMMAVLGAMAVLLGGCAGTRYVPVESVSTEYKDRVREVHTTDSVVDTRFVYVKGDTVIDYRDRVKWRECYVHDTCYVERNDTVRVTVEVERGLTRWERAKMDLGGVAIGVLGALLLGAGVWIVRKFRM